MSDRSPVLDLPLVMPDQAQKHVTVNEALLRLDALVQLCVESRTLAAQPANPANGQAYILPGNPTGPDWSGAEPGVIIVFRDGFWSLIEPLDGWRAHVRDEGRSVIWQAVPSQWRDAPSDAVLAQDDLGGRLNAWCETVELDGVSGAVLMTGLVFPDRAIMLGVSVRVIDSVTGASSFGCGISGEATKFGGALSITAGSSNIGVIGPQPVYSDTQVLLTAQGGDFTGGRVRVSAHALVCSAPA